MALFRKLVLNAPPADVWDAIATGPGWSSWYAPSELEPRKGGIARSHFGGGTYTEGTVLVYQPGKRIVIAGERASQAVGADPQQLDKRPTLEFWLAEPREELHPVGASQASVAGKPRRQTILYFRQQGFPGENQAVYEAGWDMNFHTLRQYLAHFAGKPVFVRTALAAPKLPRQEQFARLTKGLGIDFGKLKVGDRIKIKPKGRRETISGIIDLTLADAHLNAVGIQLPEGIILAASDESCGTFLFWWQYVVDPPPDFAEQRDRLTQENEKASASWQSWLQEQMAA